MNEEIIKLAKECGFNTDNTGLDPDAEALLVGILIKKLETFYKASFNAGIEAAAKEALNWDMCAPDAIRELELK